MREPPATGTCWRPPSACSWRPCWHSRSFRPFGRMGGVSIATDTDLRARLAGVAEIGPSGLTVFDAVFNEDDGLRDAARWVIWSASQALGCGSASIHELYRARGRGQVPATAF